MNTWLDDHTGPVYRYAMKYRPAACGVTCPRDGYLLVMNDDSRRQSPTYPHGYVFYSRPLTDKEVESFELVKC